MEQCNYRGRTRSTTHQYANTEGALWRIFSEEISPENSIKMHRRPPRKKVGYNAVLEVQKNQEQAPRSSSAPSQCAQPPSSQHSPPTLKFYMSSAAASRSTYLRLPEPVPALQPSILYRLHPADDVLPLDQAQLAPAHPPDLPHRLERVLLLICRRALVLGQRRGSLVREDEHRMRLADRVRRRARERRLLGRGRLAAVEVGEDERGEEVADAREVAGEAGEAARVHGGGAGGGFVGRGDAGEVFGIWGCRARCCWEDAEEPGLEAYGADDDVGDVVCLMERSYRMAEGGRVGDFGVS